jgi:hypothetical protein
MRSESALVDVPLESRYAPPRFEYRVEYALILLDQILVLKLSQLRTLNLYIKR